MSKRYTFGAFAAVMAVLVTAVHAQTDADAYPSKPIRLVIPYGTGGQTDALGRTIGRELSLALKQPVIVENKTGAGGMIGTKSVAESTPDGYTILMGTSSAICTGPLLFREPQVKPLDEFAHVAVVTSNPLFLVVNATSPVGNVKALLDLAKSRPQGLSYGSAGVGTPHHLAMEMLRQQTQINLTHVPYKGSQAAIVDLLGGQIDVMVSELTPAIAHIKSGKLKVLAVTAAERSRFLPDVPTFAEAGVPNVIMAGWNVVSGPAGLPPTVANRLNAVLNAIAEGPTIRAACETMGCEPAKTRNVGSTGAWVAEQVGRCEKVIREAGIKLP